MFTHHPKKTEVNSFAKDDHLRLQWTHLLLIVLLFSMSACQSTQPQNKAIKITDLFHDEMFMPVETVAIDDIYRLPDKFVAQFRRQFQADSTLRSQNILANEWLAQYIGAQDGGFEYRDNVTRSASETVLNIGGVG